MILEWEPNASAKVPLNVNGWIDRSDTQAVQLIEVACASPPTSPRHWLPTRLDAELSDVEQRSLLPDHAAGRHRADRGRHADRNQRLPALSPAQVSRSGWYCTNSSSKTPAASAAASRTPSATPSRCPRGRCAFLFAKRAKSARSGFDSAEPSNNEESSSDGRHCRSRAGTLLPVSARSSTRLRWCAPFMTAAPTSRARPNASAWGRRGAAVRR